MHELPEIFGNPALRKYSVISITFCIITNSGTDSSLPTVPPLTKASYSAIKCYSILSDTSISVMFCRWTMATQYVTFLNSSCIKSSQRCLHLIAAVGLVWSSNLKSYASGNTATGRVSQARQVKSEVPGKEIYHACPSWGLGSGLKSQPHKTQACWENNTIKFTMWQMLRNTTQVRLSGMEEDKIHTVLQCLWRKRRWITSSRGNFVTCVWWELLICACCMYS